MINIKIDSTRKYYFFTVLMTKYRNNFGPGNGDILLRLKMCNTRVKTRRKNHGKIIERAVFWKM